MSTALLCCVAASPHSAERSGDQRAVILDGQMRERTHAAAQTARETQIWVDRRPKAGRAPTPCNPRSEYTWEVRGSGSSSEEGGA